MKKLLIAVLCLSCLCGCSKGKTEVKKDFAKNTKTVVIDGCEYLMYVDTDQGGYSGWGYAALTHKGNCKFCKDN
ncbi:TPA: hypothetical protein HA278_04310 [Candidatus Woesearchaeota archaeon]|jgi:hypothetical protein|nr:hypothetical protein [Candidatus Woesearchaeota archaeon]